MGELEELKELLKTNLSMINSTMQMHNKLIMDLQTENRELRNKLLGNEQKASRDPLEIEVINKFKRNKKRMIKNKILETIKFKNYTIPEIKEIIVDEQRYCSKASFYRYLEELIRQDYLHINGSNIVKIKPLVETV